MGYYTDFTLSVRKAKESNIQIDRWDENFGMIQKYLNENTGYTFYANGSDLWLQEAKWYDHVNDMQELSELYPDYIFELEGDGEETGDVWKKFFHKGKGVTLKPEVVWPDEDKAIAELIGSNKSKKSTTKKAKGQV